MSHDPGTTAFDREGEPPAPTLEWLQRYLETETEQREASAQRTETIAARIFKVTVVMVCLNMVIAGANVAMIATRSSGPRTNSTAHAPIPRPQTVPPAATPTLPAPEVVLPALATADNPPANPTSASPVAPPVETAESASVARVSPPPSPPLRPAKAPVPEARVPLLGPSPTNLKPAATGVRRPAHALVKSVAARPYLSDQEEANDSYRDRHFAVERW
jgi:hypothetical protein